MRKFCPSLSALLFFFFLTPVLLHAQTAQPDALAQYRRGRDLEAQNRMQEANSYYNEAIRICQDEIAFDGGTRDSYTVLTWALRRQMRNNEVISYGERALRAFGDDYRIIETMGEAYFYMDDYTNSIRYMQRYVSSLPQGDRASVAYFFLGEIFRLQSKFHLADIAYTTAVRLESGTALWWYRLGTVREELGDFTQAAEAYQRTLSLEPGFRDTQNRLDIARRQL